MKVRFDIIIKHHPSTPTQRLWNIWIFSTFLVQCDQNTQTFLRVHSQTVSADNKKKNVNEASPSHENCFTVSLRVRHRTLSAEKFPKTLKTVRWRRSILANWALTGRRRGWSPASSLFLMGPIDRQRHQSPSRRCYSRLEGWPAAPCSLLASTSLPSSAVSPPTCTCDCRGVCAAATLRVGCGRWEGGYHT